MENLIAIKRVGRHAAGKEFRARSFEARVLRALGFAATAPKKEPAPVKTAEQKPPPLSLPKRQQYIRRDMTAGQSVPSENLYATKSDVET